MGNCNSKKTIECEKCKAQDLIDDDEFVPLPYIRQYIRRKNITIRKQNLYKIYNDEIIYKSIINNGNRDQSTRDKRKDSQA
jgi:hypothetical protein